MTLGRENYTSELGQEWGLDIALSAFGGIIGGAILGAGGYLGGFLASQGLYGWGLAVTAEQGVIGDGIGNLISQIGNPNGFDAKEFGMSILIGAIGGVIASPGSFQAFKLEQNPKLIADFLERLRPKLERSLARLGWTSAQAGTAAAAILRFFGSQEGGFAKLVDGIGDGLAHLFEGKAELSQCGN